MAIGPCLIKNLMHREPLSASTEGKNDRWPLLLMVKFVNHGDDVWLMVFSRLKYIWKSNQSNLISIIPVKGWNIFRHQRVPPSRKNCGAQLLLLPLSLAVLWQPPDILHWFSSVSPKKKRFDDGLDKIWPHFTTIQCKFQYLQHFYNIQ